MATGDQGGERVRLALIGDVHGAWRDDDDAAALSHLAADVAVFVGDFGNEDVALVRRIAKLQHASAIMLGNHEAWYCLTSRGLKRFKALHGDMPCDAFANVRAQLDAIAHADIGYKAQQVGSKRVSLVGARPFSKGGGEWSTVKNFYKTMYGVCSCSESADRITHVIKEQPDDHAIVVVGHNGPAGLGTASEDPCGVDWQDCGGDHGDVDLQMALTAAAEHGRRVALVVFGHMHDRLKTGGMRKRVHVDARNGTVCFNAAVVPRITRASRISRPPPPPPSSSRHTQHAALSDTSAQQSVSTAAIQPCSGSATTTLQSSANRTSVANGVSHCNAVDGAHNHNGTAAIDQKLHSESSAAASAPVTASNGNRHDETTRQGGATVQSRNGDAACSNADVLHVDADPVVRHFCVVDMQHGVVQRAADVWIHVDNNGSCKTIRENVLLCCNTGESLEPRLYHWLCTHSNTWHAVQLHAAETKLQLTSV